MIFSLDHDLRSGQAVTGGLDRSIRLWDPDVGELESHAWPGQVTAVAFDAAGDRLAVAADGEGIALWDITERRIVQRYPVVDRVGGLVIHPSGAWMASVGVSGANAALRIWSLAPTASALSALLPLERHVADVPCHFALGVWQRSGCKATGETLPASDRLDRLGQRLGGQVALEDAHEPFAIAATVPLKDSAETLASTRRAATRLATDSPDGPAPLIPPDRRVQAHADTCFRAWGHSLRSACR